MAACGFGTSTLKVANLERGIVTPKFINLQTLYGLKAPKYVPFDDLALSYKSNKALMIGCRSSKSEAGPDSTTNLEDNPEESLSSDVPSTYVPNPFEVESLLTVMCDTKSVMQFELKLGEFQLHVTRESAEQSAPPQAPVPAPVAAQSVTETPASDNSEPSPPLALTKSSSFSGRVQTLLDKAVDEGLAILQSPRVGYFRRSRTIKGKRAPPSCKEKDTVKEGQVLCYIEQLGGELPVESDISGEVVKILKEDGDPVGYGDALIAVLPSFPGILL
ncbi:biotin carboxyl carrier protein of acetyl-CoA carboxylase-like isoform X1 [Salvia hispanica]|uniref:biotin carboxyl carrier protein of acetyl-CoA carboxylase-like isoform X1 n=1 Tax=Salvia hispanica TaxID=49212 RepID=UPI002009A26D|nr:biotin carboxyl carrier protein of acetyl-CoA carboxylase-like isoform X1 [Salvia hispanica]